MKRRTILKNLGVGVLASNALPTWAYNWNIGSFANTNFINSQLVEMLVDAIIPKTDTPGAKEIGAHLFVGRMLKDCHTESTQTKFNNAIDKLRLSSVKTFGKPIETINSTEVLTLLKNSEDISTISLLKNLTVQAYTNSEYYLTKHKKYQMAPGYFHGCVDIQ
jgi:Gluconate 2-dehydrogenase subunit 3